MLELLEKIVVLLKAQTTLTSIVGTNIFTGPVDITMEKQADLLYPQLNVHIISEVQRSNPLNTRDTQIQFDIYSRNSQLEVENIYEALISALSYYTGSQSTAYVFWMRLNGAVDFYEADRRYWHRAVTYSAWSLKPNN